MPDSTQPPLPNVPTLIPVRIEAPFNMSLTQMIEFLRDGEGVPDEDLPRETLHFASSLMADAALDLRELATLVKGRGPILQADEEIFTLPTDMVNQFNDAALTLRLVQVEDE